MANRRQALVLWWVDNKGYLIPSNDTRKLRIFELQKKAENRGTLKRWKPKQAIPDTSNLPNPEREDFWSKDGRLIWIKYWTDNYWNPAFLVKEWKQNYDWNYWWKFYDPAPAHENNYAIYNNIRDAKRNSKDGLIDYSFKENVFRDDKYNEPIK